MEESRFEVRTISGSEAQKKLSSFLDQSFSLPSGSHFLDDFPVWDEQNKARMFRAGVYQGENLVCSAGARLAELKIRDGVVIPVGMIGLVATNEQYRGQGMASDVVSQLVDELEKAGALVTFLWGSEHSLYQKLGFELCGEQIRVPVEKALGSSPVESKFKEGSGWEPALFQLMKDRSCGLSLETSDLHWMSRHKNVLWLWTESNGKINAYVGYGRGIDLGGIVHEWGGDPQGVRQLLKKVQSANPKAELIGPRSLLEEYRFSFENDHVEFLCMGKVSDAKRFVEKCQLQVSFEVDRIDKDGESMWKIQLGPEVIHLTDPEMTKILLGPERFDELKNDPLPVPVWLWGLDSC